MIVLSVGGSLICPGSPDAAYLKQLSKLLIKHRASGLAIVTGGGSHAREYAKAVRALGGNEFLADDAAVVSTKQNARLLIAALGEHAHPTVPEDFRDASLLSRDRIIVMGGTIPGITTDTDAVLLAEMLGAKRLVNLSNVNGVYSSDPSKNKKAKKYKSLTHEKMINLALASDTRKAGEHFVFDLFACKLASRSKMELHFVNGKSFADVEKAIHGKAHGGTVVR
ncbi:MAG: UMP kinase [Candidatus Micrarchaeota archaeon]|nr:UMP kinase [Candidatus Micrarchaeota archaeon]